MTRLETSSSDDDDNSAYTNDEPSHLQLGDERDERERVSGTGRMDSVSGRVQGTSSIVTEFEDDDEVGLGEDAGGGPADSGLINRARSLS